MNITSKSMQSVAIKLIDFLSSKELFSNVQIYAGNKRFSSEKLNSDQIQKRTKNNNVYYIDNDINITEYIENADPKTIGLTFEGPLYELINYEDYDFIYTLTEKFISEYKLYFDMINSFSIAAYRA